MAKVKASARGAAVGNYPHSVSGQAETTPLLHLSKASTTTDEYLPSLILLGFINYVTCAEWSLVMPSLFAYISDLGGSQACYGFVLCGFEAMQLVAKPIMGVWADRRPTKEVYISTLLLGILGNILYSLAETMGLYVLIAGRLIAGIGAANMVVGLGYLTRTTTEENRTKYMARMGIVRMVGMSSGPVFTLLFDSLHVPVIWGYEINSMTAPGIFTAIMLVLCCLAASRMKEPPKLQKKTPAVAIQANPEEKVLLCIPRTNTVNDALWLLSQPSCLLCMLVTFTVNVVVSVANIMVPPVTKGAFNWTPMYNSLVFSAMAFEIIIGAFVVGSISVRVHDRFLILWGLAFMLLSCFIMEFTFYWDMKVWQFLLGELCLNASLPFINSPNISLFSKITQRHDPTNISFHQGILAITASLGAVIGPVWVGFSLGKPYSHGPVGHITIGLVILIAAVNLLCLVRYFHTLELVDECPEHKLSVAEQEEMSVALSKQPMSAIQQQAAFMTPRQEEYFIKYGTPTPTLLAASRSAVHLHDSELLDIPEDGGSAYEVTRRKTTPL